MDASLLQLFKKLVNLGLTAEIEDQILRMKVGLEKLVSLVSFGSHDVDPFYRNKAGYTATEVACGWAGAIFEVTRPFGQEQ